MECGLTGGKTDGMAYRPADVGVDVAMRAARAVEQMYIWPLKPYSFHLFSILL